jgi:membrane fusion protein (multidrug efflux system)
MSTSPHDSEDADRGATSRPPARERRDRPEHRAGERHEPADDERGWRRRPALGVVVVLVVIALLTAGLLFWRHSRQYEKSDDAFIDVASERVSAQIAGRVLKVLVGDNQDVTAGQALVEIDPDEYRLRMEQARAGVAQAEAQIAQARAEEAVRTAQLEQARAAQTAAEAERERAELDVRRLRKLRDLRTGAVSQEQLDHAEAGTRSAAAQAQASARAVGAARAQVEFARSQIVAAEAAIKAAQAQLHQAELQVSYATVKSRTAGRIANKTVAEGNYIQPGAELMAVVPREVFVTANFKETQLDHIRRGDPVEIRIDAYHKLRLTGRVDSIQPASGQAFSVLPAQNAAGNWVKVVQRVPVKIVLDRVPDDPDIRLATGMSAKVEVSIR